ncbi:MAG: PQQ-binding-like beta-propeller repeat protein [Acidimicrobiales bacterium]
MADRVRRRRHRSWPTVVGGVLATVLVASCTSPISSAGSGPVTATAKGPVAAAVRGSVPSTVRTVDDVTTTPGPWDWPTYGHDAQHTFHGLTTLTKASVKHLKVAWFFPTGDAVTATPTVVGGTVYVGSWDGNFYALDLETGAVLWKFQLTPQDAVTPYPGEQPRDATSDGGLVTSSAWYQPADRTRPALVIFGGGYTLYALNAVTGALYWSHDYTGQPAEPPNPNADGTRIFSSPVVVGDKVIFGTDVDGANGYRGYIAAASLSTGDPVWEFQTDINSSGHVGNDGCGNVWSSGSVLPALGLVVFDTADCNFGDSEPLDEAILALRVDTGHLAWVYRPQLPDLLCDWDFGATVNVGINDKGVATFLGAASKGGTYYSLSPATGQLRWATNVVFGGFAGGFIATTAYDGHRIYGSTAIGDFGDFEMGKQLLCDPSNPEDTAQQQPTVHAFVATSGAVAWQVDDSPSFAPTTVAGGMTFNGPALDANVLEVRDASNGKLLDSVGVPGPIWSGVATVGDALITGVGSSYAAQPAGVAVVTPGGAPPVVP